MSTDSAGNQQTWSGPMYSERPVWSPDSTRILFESASPFLVPGDTNVNVDLFIKNINTNAHHPGVHQQPGRPAQRVSPSAAAWSPDGGRIAFDSKANDVVAGDTNVHEDIFVKNLIGAVILTLGGQLQQALADAFGDGPLPPAELFERAWPALADADSVFGLFFQIVGLAAAGTKPYDSIAPALVEQWLTWLEPRVAVQGAARRRREALALMARIDGLLLLRQTLGPAAADGAAEVITLG